MQSMQDQEKLYELPTFMRMTTVKLSTNFPGMTKIRSCVCYLFQSYILILLGFTVGFYFAELQNSVPSHQERNLADGEYNLSLRNGSSNTTSSANVTDKAEKLNQAGNKSESKSLECRYLPRANSSSLGWFEENFDPFLNPIMTKDNLNISQDIFQWWNNLLSQSNSSYETYKDLAEEIVRNQDVFDGKKPADRVRCAVVGNSGNLKKSAYGMIIDKHDLIIRMNNCPIRKFETDVGSRTTHYIAYPNSYRKRDDLRKALFVMAAFNIKDLQWLKKYLKYRRRSIVHPIAADKDKVFVLNPELMWHIKHQWGLGMGRWASTGLLSVFFGLHICDEVNIFGFGANSKGNWDHYFESNDGKKNSQFRITKVHDSNAEEKILQMLSDAKKVTIYKGPD